MSTARKIDASTAIWDAVKRPPESALKQIKGGRLTGMTDVNPQWRYRAMTEVFGPCGQGWKYEIARTWTDAGTEGQILAFAEIHLWWNDGEQWQGPIPGIGGSMLVAKERDGLRTNDEAFKMATTDALSVAMKMLGVAADIYAGRWDGTKYKEEDVAPTIMQPRRLSDRKPEPPQYIKESPVLNLTDAAKVAEVVDEADPALVDTLMASIDEINAKADVAQVTNSYITEAQRKRLFGIFKGSGHTPEQVKAWLGKSSKEITQHEYDAICERLSDPTPLVA